MLPAGKVIGPYTGEAVVKLVREGAANEECRIKKMGTGTWVQLSKEPQFFDAILEAINNPATRNGPTQTAENFLAETVIVRAPNSAEPTAFPDPDFKNQNDEMTVAATGEVVIDPQAIDPAHSDGKLQTGKTKKKSVGDILDLQNISDIVKKDKIKASKGPLLLVAGAVAVALIALFMDGAPTAEDLRLIMPRLELQKPIHDNNELAARNRVSTADFAKARSFFWADTVEGYLQAQATLVPSIEANPNFLPSRGLLCLVYRELWPYVKQTKPDTEAMNKLAKSTKSVDSMGPAGVHCELARLFTQGKLTEARGIVDYHLESVDIDRVSFIREQEAKGIAVHRFATDPVMMSFRAELLANLKDDQLQRSDPSQAAAYVQNIQQYTPKWVKMYYLHARYLLQAGRAQEAAQAFERTLKLNGNHKPAMIEYGIMNFTQFRQGDKALNFISGALNTRGIISRNLEARAHFTLARIFSERRDFSEALTHAEKAYELNPSDNSAKNMIVELGGSVRSASETSRNNTLVFEGDQHEREGDCLMAQGLYKSAFEADSKNALAAMKAGKCLKTLNRPREAIDWLQRAIKVDPNLTTAYLLLADYHSEAYDFRRAESVLNQVSSRFPNQFEILRGYGLVAFREGDYKAALGFLNRALKSYDGDIETLILLAKTNLAAQEYEKAVSLAGRALELDRANVEAHIMYGKALAPYRGLDAAIRYLREQRIQFSKNIEFPLAIAELYQNTGRCSIAETEYKAVIEWRPDTKAAYMGLGECYFLAGNIMGSLKSFFDAAYTDPSDPDPLLRIAMIYLSANRYNEAIPQLKRAIEVSEFKPMLRYYLGKAYFGMGDYTMALQYAKAEAEHHPFLPDAYILTGDIHAKTDNYKACADEYQKAVGLRKNNRAELYVNMARCQRQAQNLDGAQGSLDIALSLESGRPEIYREQGALFELRGDLRAAAQAYNKYLTLSPNAADRVEVEGQLGKMGGRVEQ